MRKNLKPVREQVMVITGASSGIGLTTARMAARQGAKVVLASRNLAVLERVAAEIHESGGEALAVEVDVGDEGAVERLADAAIARFGRIDTWVNNAGVSVYGTLLEVPIHDQRRLFETNYWGLVHGSLIAARRMTAGAIVNVGSILSDRAVPLQGAYSASKAAVKGFTDALRMELEKAERPISVTLVKPGAIATPYHQHARNYMGEPARNPPPVYAPELVAKAILRAATEPVRELYVGTGGRLIAAFSQGAPRLADLLMRGTMFKMQRGGGQGIPQHEHDNLYEAGEDGEERGYVPERVFERSAYDGAMRSPLRALVFASVAVLGLTLVARTL